MHIFNWWPLTYPRPPWLETNQIDGRWWILLRALNPLWSTGTEGQTSSQETSSSEDVSAVIFALRVEVPVHRSSQLLPLKPNCQSVRWTSSCVSTTQTSVLHFALWMISRCEIVDWFRCKWCFPATKIVHSYIYFNGYKWFKDKWHVCPQSLSVSSWWGWIREEDWHVVGLLPVVTLAETGRLFPEDTVWRRRRWLELLPWPLYLQQQMNH